MLFESDGIKDGGETEGWCRCLEAFLDRGKSVFVSTFSGLKRGAVILWINALIRLLPSSPSMVEGSVGVGWLVESFP